MSKLNNLDRMPISGSDFGGNYTYYEPIDALYICCGCSHLADNKSEERFECLVKDCPRANDLYNI